MGARPRMPAGGEMEAPLLVSDADEGAVSAIVTGFHEYEGR